MKEKIQRGDRFDCLDPQAEKLEKNPHVSLWRVSPQPYRYPRNRAWYACLNWCGKDRGQKFCGQTNLSDCYFYHRALSAAIAYGKKLNVPVLKHHNIGDITVLWMPERRSGAQEKKDVKRLQEGKKAIRPVFDSMGRIIRLAA